VGKVVRFSNFNEYYKQLPISDESELGTILDANVLIALSYDPKKYHSRIHEFLRDQIYSINIKCFTTVNTTMEYLEFHRRLLMTEGLRDAIDQYSKLNLSNKKKQAIRARSSILATREKHHGSDPVFYDREIKAIRAAFAKSGMAGLGLWKGLSEEFVGEALQEEYKNLNSLNVDYVSINSKAKEAYFHKDLKWEEAIEICSTTCAGFSDAMILNALMCTKFHFAISLDSDMAFATLADDSLKDVVMPDELLDNDEVLCKLA
jgi:hypothetical protein